jgi:hypothetical protein
MQTLFENPITFYINLKRKPEKNTSTCLWGPRQERPIQEFPRACRNPPHARAENRRFRALGCWAGDVNYTRRWLGFFNLFQASCLHSSCSWTRFVFRESLLFFSFKVFVLHVCIWWDGWPDPYTWVSYFTMSPCSEISLSLHRTRRSVVGRRMAAHPFSQLPEETWPRTWPHDEARPRTIPPTCHCQILCIAWEHVCRSSQRAPAFSPWIPTMWQMQVRRHKAGSHAKFWPLKLETFALFWSQAVLMAPWLTENCWWWCCVPTADREEAIWSSRSMEAEFETFEIFNLDVSKKFEKISWRRQCCIL